MLSENESAEFCMIMRVVSFMQSNESLFAADADIQQELKALQECVAAILECLDASEKDKLLEQYSDELQFLNQQDAQR